MSGRPSWTGAKKLAAAQQAPKSRQQTSLTSFFAAAGAPLRSPTNAAQASSGTPAAVLSKRKLSTDETLRNLQNLGSNGPGSPPRQSAPPPQNGANVEARNVRRRLGGSERLPAGVASGAKEHGDAADDADDGAGQQRATTTAAAAASVAGRGTHSAPLELDDESDGERDARARPPAAARSSPTTTRSSPTTTRSSPTTTRSSPTVIAIDDDDDDASATERDPGGLLAHLAHGSRHAPPPRAGYSVARRAAPPLAAALAREPFEAFSFGGSGARRLAAPLAPPKTLVLSGSSTQRRALPPFVSSKAGARRPRVSNQLAGQRRGGPGGPGGAQLAAVESLSAEQRSVLDVVESGQSVFFTGAAGTGKSYLLQVLITRMRNRYGLNKVAVTASTGAAAVNIGGTTLHAFAGVGLGQKKVDELASIASSNTQARRRWRNTKVLVIDEISMISGDFLDKIDYVARHVRGTMTKPLLTPFGGIQLVVAGDFLQLPPVFSHSGPQLYAFESRVWNHALNQERVLYSVHRQRDTRFVRMLNELRRGRFSDESRRILESRTNVTLKNPVRLFSRRINVAQQNSEQLRNLPSQDLVSYQATDTAQTEHHRTQLQRNCCAPQTLELKIGAQVLLLKNLDIEGGLVNGSQGIVRGFTADRNRHPRVRFANGVERTITETEWTIELAGMEVAKRVQIPLMLAWAITTHKAQGMSIDNVECDIGDCFSTGQAYVALSRARSLEGLKITSMPRQFLCDPRVVSYYDKLEALDVNREWFEKNAAREQSIESGHAAQPSKAAAAAAAVSSADGVIDLID